MSRPAQDHTPDVARAMYTRGEYRGRHPTWHVEDSPWKAAKIEEIVRRHGLGPVSICEVGCGAGEVLRNLCERLAPAHGGVGYEIAPHAHEIATTRATPQLEFVLGNAADDPRTFDLMLCVDVFEHVEDYLGFLRRIHFKAPWTVFHIPLDLSVQSVARRGRLMKSRREIGHLHHFTRDLALQALLDAGYEPVDDRYTAGALERPCQSLKCRLARAPRKLARRIDEDLAARWLGGFSLLVLAR